MPNAHVIGLGKSGIAAAQLLKRQGWEVTLSDRSSAASPEQPRLESEGIAVKLGYSWHPDVDDSTQLVVVSPGVPWDIPALIAAREQGIETIGEMELAWRNLRSHPWVAVTGTNGKTTTTALIAAIFQTTGLNAPACGNIGYAACELALESAKPLDWVIAEISSYQIESSSSIAPRIGIWTTFTPDHLSRHCTLENYYNIKAQLLRQSELQIFNGDDAYLKEIGANWQDAYWTSVKGKAHLIGNTQGTYIEDGWVVFQGDRIVQVSALRMVGEHNHQNLLMAVAAARLAGIDQEAIFQAVTNFPGVPHRLEHICTIAGVDFINDSKATNYDAAQVGLSAVVSPVILIAGGEAKAGDDTSWLQTIQEKAAAVLLIGDAAPRFAQRLKDVGYSHYEIVETMERAVSRSAELAPQTNARVVLLSPACASFDQFQNFEQRGDRFRELCLALV
ncbi:UDP-N-acetylmuramoyl-L-alanine--D-glutamate ligase [Gloeocapsopsis sp. IPPAS B-1203]|uniref:UDP-N-acetylmuramoyl-L-alanine--D-glutamate ligase n=1 Tax=Gloeocapsopsis sp. IPPAS B-1203 TaxID=2049454 RepID=UPI000C18E816|nr:UDP-N-acetylmuramoyl-L-alanine--D-glutamate ligase [Gloeocapsopsis sp. IPPAS B-1203]PIG92635.1 UDP-N-acetylmuramoyl-L-alanine--D-glutamate ligase [Gloeocapsopsis sp. IPPAS B-1203]